MFFRKKKQDNRVHPTTIKIVLVIFLLNMIYISFFGGDNKQAFAMQCDMGPLVSMDSCKEEHSPADSKSKWWFSDVYGALDKKICSQMSMEDEALNIPIQCTNETDVLMKSACSSIGLTDDNFCYTSQRLSADGTTRYVAILTTNSHCGEPRYFRGQNATLFDYRIKANLDPKEVIANMPEIKK